MLRKPIFWLILKTKRFSGIAPILVKLTGKSKEPIHPKHLISIEKPWFTKKLKKGDYVLDIGCGNGQNTLKAAPFCKKIIGLELNKRQLEIAKREKLRKKIDNVDFVFGNAEKKLIFKSSAFDAVLILDVLEHLVNRNQILKEIYRVLKNNGRLVLSVPNKETSWKKNLKKANLPYYSDPDHKIEYTFAEIKEELSKNGFKIIKVMPVIYDFPLIGVVDLIGGLSLALYKRLVLWRKKKVRQNPKETTGFRIICQKITHK